MVKCSAPYCQSATNAGNEERTFHMFPTDEELRRKWLENIGRIGWNPGKRCVLCSVHFEGSAFLFDHTGQASQLREDAVPTIFWAPPKGNKNNTKENQVVHGAVKYLNLKDHSSSNASSLTKPSEKVQQPSQNNVSGSNAVANNNIKKRLQRWQFGTWICRLCGVASRTTIDLFGSESINSQIIRKLQSVLSIKIEKGDGMPHSICGSCLSKLDICVHFISTSLNTHKQLASVFLEKDSEANSEENPQQKMLLVGFQYPDGAPIEHHIQSAITELSTKIRPENDHIPKPSCKVFYVPEFGSIGLSRSQQISKAVEAMLCQNELSQDTRFISYEEESQNPSRDPFEDHFIPDHVDTDSESDVIFLNNENSHHYCDEIIEIPDESDGEVQTVQERQAEFQPTQEEQDQSEESSVNNNEPVQQFWPGRDIAVTNIQQVFRWDETDYDDLKLRCEVCSYLVDTKEEALVHLEQHLDLRCQKCLNIFIEGDDLLNHVCKVESKRRKPKPKNQKGLKSLYRSKLKKSLQLSRKNGSKFSRKKQVPVEYQCPQCTRKYKSEENLKKHIADHENNKIDAVDPGFLCDICGKHLKNSTNRRAHRLVHVAPEVKNTFRCTLCPKRYPSPGKLREHMATHTGKQHMCLVCGALFFTKGTLRQHEFTHGDPLFYCSESDCSKGFFRRAHLRLHMRVHQTGMRRSGPGSAARRYSIGHTRCRECPGSFEPAELVTHYKNQHPEVDLSPYTCDVCMEENSSYASLYEHQRVSHNNKNRTCPFCAKQLSSSTRMRYHLMMHDGMHPYHCPTCDNGYFSNSMLTDHMRKHTGERPYQCDECPKTFVTNSALIQHKTVHFKGDRLLRCLVCNQGFKRKAHLSIHVRTHTGEKPYPCPICNRHFRQKTDCLKHVKVIHGQDPKDYKFSYVPNTGTSNLVSVAEMQLVLEGEDLMQTASPGGSE